LKINKKSPHIFLVLVPHRDTRLILRKYSAALFKNGNKGAYSFPWVVPVASLSCSLTATELKHCAHTLRESNKGKICAAEAATVEFLQGDNNAALFGPRLDLQISQDAYNGEKTAEKLIKVFSPPVIGACLFSEAEGKPTIQPPPLSFRAAAVANMFWYSDKQGGAFYCKWEIGKLFWIPKVDKATEGRQGCQKRIRVIKTD
jgi:hypothetical protein